MAALHWFHAKCIANAAAWFQGQNDLQDQGQGLLFPNFSENFVHLFMKYEGQYSISQKVVCGKKTPTHKNLAAHLEIVTITPKI